MTHKKITLFIIFHLTLMLIVGCTSKTFNTTTDWANSHLDVLHQDIDISVDLDNKRLFGNTRLEILPNKIVDSIRLNAVQMSIKYVKNKDGNSIGYTVNDSLITINLQNNIDFTDTLILDIGFETLYENQSDPSNIWGSFGNGVRYFQTTQTENERRQQLWAFGEPNSSRYWFPSNDNPEDLRTTNITISVEKHLLAISSGSLVSSVQNGDNIIYNWISNQQYSPHNTFLVVGAYANVEQKYQDVNINNYGYPDEKLGTKESVIRLPDMMKFFSEYMGVKYPYKSYSQIFVQDFGGWKPGLATSIITENMIDDKTTHEDFFYGWDLTESEALAAQWFGSYLKPKSWNDTWLTKGFSRYFSGLYNEYKNGNTEFLTYQLSPDLSAYLSDWNAELQTIVVPDNIEDVDYFVNSNAPYLKGARVLHMLRKELGEKKWKQLIQTYVNEYSDKLITTEDFIDVVNQIANKPMNWFFEQWIYGVGHPKFRVEHRFNDARNELTLDIYQQQKVDSTIGGKRIPFFKGKMLIEINEKVESINIEAAYKNTFVFSTNTSPSLVNLDFEDTWIKEQISIQKEAEQLLIELKTSKDVLHRITTMQRLTSRVLSDTTDAEIRSKVKDALLSQSFNEDYWRMRLTAISQLGQLFNPSSDFKIVLDKKTEKVLLQLVERETSWVKAWTINFLGNTRDQKYVPIYLEGLKDYSDRVVFMSAIALGKSRDSKAYTALMDLPKKPSWKNQSLISALYGLKELKDLRGYDLAMDALFDSNKPHWNLATPIWDHRLAAAYTLKALDKTEEGSKLVFKNFSNAIEDGNMNDIFYNAQTLGILGGEYWLQAVKMLKKEYAIDKNVIRALENLENQFPVN
ncbi:M1 family aminopeptidase [Croceitalea rosinachiae]|uniref:Transcription initiation factor TFIID subunit 2 n=1 Tax=Croceitalea rosinachiae TaxID=3075596 RepID=A0ABU3AFX4_9FLAO|nr:M1 family aminopeptidase [Croceitalea sp. F388]MDT0608462.1 M1 family aminopeptidase [Croceitalea sp. F388]